jgi:hypothetical protein
MKIIPFPSKKNPSNPPPVRPEDLPIEQGELIDFIPFNKDDFLDESLESTAEVEITIGGEDSGSFYDKVLKAAKDICADENDMAAAICTMVDELTLKTAPLREKYFLPQKSFYKMVGNDHFEDRFQRIITSFPSMTDYHGLTLSQIAVMLDKKWPFTAVERVIIDFALHLLGALKHTDLLKLKAYISETEWQIATEILATEEL